MQKYRWTHPQEWLDEKIASADAEDLRSIARELSRELDGDSIQTLFQSEMDEDGYFETVAS